MSIRIVNIKGSSGRIEGKYYTNDEYDNSPVALILHPHPLYGGNMDSKIVFTVYKALASVGFNVLRINFRGVGNSEGKFDNGVGELHDALAAFDWLQIENAQSENYWIAGFSFGSWIAMELLMRRPEISSFIAVAPPVNKYEFSFLSPCQVSGLVVQGDMDEIVDCNSVISLMSNETKVRLNNAKLKLIQGADHFFTNCLREVYDSCRLYAAQSVKNSNNDQNSRYHIKKKRKNECTV